MPTFRKVTNECNMPFFGLPSNIRAVTARRARDARKKNGHTSKPRKTESLQGEPAAPEDEQAAPVDEQAPHEAQQPAPESEQPAPEPKQPASEPAHPGTSSRKPRAYKVSSPAEKFHSSTTSRPNYNQQQTKLTKENLEEHNKEVEQEQAQTPKV